MLFPGMAIARKRGLIPMDQSGFTFLRRELWIGAGIDQPVLESFIFGIERMGGLRKKRFEVVKGKTGADDQYVFLS